MQLPKLIAKHFLYLALWQNLVYPLVVFEAMHLIQAPSRENLILLPL